MKNLNDTDTIGDLQNILYDGEANRHYICCKNKNIEIRYDCRYKEICLFISNVLTHLYRPADFFADTTMNNLLDIMLKKAISYETSIVDNSIKQVNLMLSALRNPENSTQYCIELMELHK